MLPARNQLLHCFFASYMYSIVSFSSLNLVLLNTVTYTHFLSIVSLCETKSKFFFIIYNKTINTKTYLQKTCFGALPFKFDHFN